MPYTLVMGPVRLEWRIAETEPVWQEFRQAYAAYSDSAPGDLVIDAEVSTPAATAGCPRLPNSFIRARSVQGQEFDLGAGLVKGRVQSDSKISCTIHPALLSGTGLRVLEQFIYLLFHQHLFGRESPTSSLPFLLHSSGVVHQGQVYVFCGPAGSGKSTAASLCPARPLLSDEALIMQRAGNSWLVSSSPINPFCQDKEPGQGILAGIFLLEHGAEHAVLPIGREEAVPRLTAEVMVPLGLLETDLALGMSRSLDNALALYRTGLVHRLTFAPDPDFWQYVLRSCEVDD